MRWRRLVVSAIGLVLAASVGGTPASAKPPAKPGQSKTATAKAGSERVKVVKPAKSQAKTTTAAKAKGGKPGNTGAATARAAPVPSEPPSGDGIRVGDDITMTPNGRDGTGCQRYSMSSRGFGPLQAVFYRTAKGDFTTDRNEAACQG